jgi:hypothetical protein
MDLAFKSGLPALFVRREYAEAGGLISCGVSYREMYRTAADYIARILKGENPADLPVQQPVKSPWFLLPLLLVYAITVPADSGALTSGMTMAADPNYSGATMAMHSTVGFSLSTFGARGVGVALDLAGGPSKATA